ncbi:signal recognition particle, SRP9/SRP14 subunit [Hyaloraphidium curvatum]|nr:signal recognition particle, SRP9/SRP14 subunit [Hyaloraphidium curvatum]
MVYIELWDEFQRAVEELYAAAPTRTRFVTRYRHADGMLILRVTDGPTTLSYRTDRLPDLRKLERLNRSLMEKMMCRKAPEEGAEQAAAVAGAPTGGAPSGAQAAGASPSVPGKRATPQQPKKGGGPVRGKGKKGR